MELEVKLSFDSKDKLYRNCIVFNNEGQEVSNNTDFQGTAYFIYKAGDADIKRILTKENYCIGYKLVRIGDALSVGTDVFNFCINAFFTNTSVAFFILNLIR